MQTGETSDRIGGMVSNRHKYFFSVVLEVFAAFALLGCEGDDISPPRVTEPADAIDTTPVTDSKQLPVESVEVIRVRLTPFKSATGLRLKVVLVDWKNIGDAPIRAVDANIILFDGRGRLDRGAKDYAIYAESDDSPGIAPGEVYREPVERGHILDGELARRARRARVQFTEVLETGVY